MYCGAGDNKGCPTNIWKIRTMRYAPEALTNSGNWTIDMINGEPADLRKYMKDERIQGVKPSGILDIDGKLYLSMEAQNYGDNPLFGRQHNLYGWIMVSENEGKTFEEVLEHHRNKKILSMEQLQELADLAHQNHITVASHDDDTVEKLQLNRQLGVDISEFPITEEVAKAAHEMGFYTIAGAPNILLGGSHSGNMSAAQAIQNQSVDILCSDYFPQALLHSLFVMCDKHGQTLPDMVNKVSLNPAKAMGIDKDYGSIEVGKKADLVIADILDGYPVVTHVLVDGQTTSRVEYRGHSI